MAEKKLALVLTESERKELISALEDELGDPYWGRDEGLIQSVLNKSREAPFVKE